MAYRKANLAIKQDLRKMVQKGNGLSIPRLSPTAPEGSGALIFAPESS
jgi:hypothetical protein